MHRFLYLSLEEGLEMSASIPQLLSKVALSRGPVPVTLSDP